jgi:DNA-binding MarR family transcriptional regulator
MSYPPPSNNLVILLKRVHLATRRAFDEALAQHDLTGPQVEVMQHVWLQDGAEQRMLQECMVITSATLTGIVDGLVERGLVERRLHPHDARVKQLFLTGKGRDLGEVIPTIAAQIEAQLTQGFSAAEQALLLDWLRRMEDNIGSHCDDDCG